MPLEPANPRYFYTPAELQGWFREHHDEATELWLGFHRKDSGLATLTYAEALDEALCWGWIDGIRKRWDATSYVQRFTPRNPRSIWSKVNIAKVAALEAAGRMQPAGRAAFEKRDEKRCGIYAFEREQPASFAPERLREFKANGGAWAYFTAQAPYYQRTLTHWVESAKQEATRTRRLTKLIEYSARSERVP
ncbi:YdeI/OmpD-associated family protein [Actomonas aquatica]|uniref:YdeI/OmpD-associated family protein n=1 Tax=Actomonas aquatica TaxID=2866162 RepID=A0ABZ1C9F8_9BACT|nr:YdeI/OmpD-associated family protein [Opitutus sp. WL0086]WRQ88334.1 YdeI/OmpD-associated family protein [Opitutus sp. WL0086]